MRQGHILGQGTNTPTRYAVCFQVDADKYLKHVSVPLARLPCGGTTELSVLRWELREGTAATVAGLNGSTKITEGTWTFNNDDVWPPYCMIWKTAVFPDPVLCEADKYYFFVVYSGADSQNLKYCAAWYDVGYNTDDPDLVSFKYEGGWSQISGWDLALLVNDDQAGVKYHVVVDGVGYMTPHNLRSYSCQLASQFGAGLRGGMEKHSDLTYPYSSFSQDTWKHGMGWEYFEDPETMRFGWNLDCRVEHQAILGPEAKLTVTDTAWPYHISDKGKMIGLPWTEKGQNVKYIAQQFSTDQVVRYLTVRVRRTPIAHAHTPNLKVALYNDNGDKPGTKIAEVDITGMTGWALRWERADIADYTPSGTEKLWLVVYTDEDFTQPYFEVVADPEAGYSGGKCMYSADGTNWTDVSSEYSLQFLVNWNLWPDEEAFFAEYNGTLYVACGETIWKWSETDQKWYGIKTFSGQVATSMIVFDDKLWVAYGDGKNVAYYDGTTWVDDAGYKAHIFFIGKGYLWKSNGDNTINYSNNGTSWSSPIAVGDNTSKVTGFTLFNDVVVVSKEDGLWYIDDDWLAHSYFSYEDQKHETNGKYIKTWSDNVYINILSGLWRWTGSSVTMVGPDRRAGLPKGFEGPVTHLVSAANWLFAAIDSEGSGWSHILAYNGIGWLPLVSGFTHDTRIRGMTFTSTIGNELRLWFMDAQHIRYVKFSPTTENHYDWEDARYEFFGLLRTPWWNGGLYAAKKYFNEVTVEADVPEGTWIDVYYRINGEDTLYYLGTISQYSGTNTLHFGDEIEATSIQLEFHFYTTDNTKTPRLRSYNVECLVRPEPAYVHSVTLTIADDLELMDRTHCTRSAEELLEHLKIAAAKPEPILVSFPWTTIRGWISALVCQVNQYKEHGEPKWEQFVNLSIVEA